MFSEIAEIALVAARLGQFLQFLKTRVILILNFTRPHAITNTKPMQSALSTVFQKAAKPITSKAPVSGSHDVDQLGRKAIEKSGDLIMKKLANQQDLQSDRNLLT